MKVQIYTAQTPEEAQALLAKSGYKGEVLDWHITRGFYPNYEAAKILGPGRMASFLKKHAYSGRQTPEELVELPYDETAMKSNSTGRSIDRARSLMKTKAPLSTQMSSGAVPA